MKVTVTFEGLSRSFATDLIRAANMIEFGELPNEVVSRDAKHEPINDASPLRRHGIPAAEAAPANPTDVTGSAPYSAPEASMNILPTRRRRGVPSDTGADTPKQTSDAGSNTEASPRRRRGGSVSETSSPSEGESAENPTLNAGPAVRRSRRTDTTNGPSITATTASPAVTPTKTETSQASPEDQSASTSRRRRDQSTEPQPTPALATPAPVAGRRRRTETSATPASVVSPSEDKISDHDLGMAASQAATKITPKAVMEIMEEFGVGKVNDLKPEQRREFLDALKDAMKPGN